MEQHSMMERECNSKEGFSIVSVDKEFVAKKGTSKRKRRKSKATSYGKIELMSSNATTTSSNDVAIDDTNLVHKVSLSQHKSNTNNNDNLTFSVPICRMRTTTPTETLLLQKDMTKNVTEGSSSSSLQKSPSAEEILPKITSPVEVTPEPQMPTRKGSRRDRPLEPRKKSTAVIDPSNPWPKYTKDVQHCIYSLDKLNDELNNNCDYAASEMTELFGELQLTLQHRQRYLLLELETLRSTASALLAERWEVGTQLKRKTSKMSSATEEHTELEQEVQQFTADRKLDKEIASKSRFFINRRDTLRNAKNIGKVENYLPIYSSLIMANSKLKPTGLLQETSPTAGVAQVGGALYNEHGWVANQLVPLDLNYGVYSVDPLNDIQIIPMDSLIYFDQQMIPSLRPVNTQTKSQLVMYQEGSKGEVTATENEISAEKSSSKLSAEELLAIQNRVRESLLKQGVRLYPPDGMEDSGSNSQLTSSQREKKRQKRHRYRERKRQARRAERMEQMSDSSNSLDIGTGQQQQQDASPHHKKDKTKQQLPTDNEEPNTTVFSHKGSDSPHLINKQPGPKPKLNKPDESQDAVESGIDITEENSESIAERSCTSISSNSSSNDEPSLPLYSEPAEQAENKTNRSLDVPLNSKSDHPTTNSEDVT